MEPLQYDQAGMLAPTRAELSKRERDDVLKKHLPATPLPPMTPVPRAAGRKLQRNKPMRTFVRNRLHFLIYAVIHTLFSVYMRLRTAYHAVIDRIFAVLYYHHRTPELIQKDVKNLSRVPEHLSVVLDFNGDGRSLSGLEGLVNDVSEISAWCAGAGIPFLSVYERTGTNWAMNCSRYRVHLMCS